MTDVLTVPTHFTDIAELSYGFADRVDDQRLILYGPEAYDEGSEVGFAVLLVDGTPALEGTGRISASIDGGEERAPETRFDIIFDGLQLDGRYEVVFERICLARQSVIGEGPATGEVDISELDSQVVASVPPSSIPPAPVEETSEPIASEPPVAVSGDDAMSIAPSEPPPEESSARRFASLTPDPIRDDEIPRGAAAPAPPPPPSGFDVAGLPETVLARPRLETAWTLESPSPSEPGPSDGMFQYGPSVPIPNQPPRPDIATSERVHPAPRPGGARSPEPAPAYADAEAEADAREEAFTELGTGEIALEELE
jgi:hypothetical protein